MSDNPESLQRWPEPLKRAAALAWSAFSANSARLEIEIAGWPDAIGNSVGPVWAESPFVAEQCTGRPELLKELVESGRLLRSIDEESYRADLRSLLERADTETELMTVLRRFRNREMVRIAWRDIAGWADWMKHYGICPLADV